MLLVLVCLWIGFAAGMVCASLMRASQEGMTAGTERRAPSIGIEEDWRRGD